MSERDPIRRSQAGGPAIRLLDPYQDPPRRPLPRGLQLLSDPLLAALPARAVPCASSLADDETVVLASLEPATEPLQSLAAPPVQHRFTAEREEEPSLVTDPTDPEMLTGTMALTPRFEALWVNTQSSWAIPNEDSERVGMRDLRVVLAAFLLLCVVAGAFAFWSAGDSPAPDPEQTVSPSS